MAGVRKKASGTEKEKRRSSPPVFVTCPLCNARVIHAVVNQHLDKCTGAAPAPAASPRSSAGSVGGHGSQDPPSQPLLGSARAAKRRRTGGADAASAGAGSEAGGGSPASAGAARAGTAATAASEARPLADRMRPSTLEELVGQDSAIGEGSALRMLVQKGQRRVLRRVTCCVPCRDLVRCRVATQTRSQA